MRTQNLSRIAGVLAVLIWPMLSRSATSSNDDSNLHRVRTIFLEEKRNDEMNQETLADLKRLNSVLKDALVNIGFMVVENVADADAVLAGDKTQWIILDGPQPDPPKYHFHYVLVSTRINVKWQTDFDVASRAQLEVEGKGMQKVAQNLFRAWKQSAKKAGIRVGDRLP